MNVNANLTFVLLDVLPKDRRIEDSLLSNQIEGAPSGGVTVSKLD